MASEQTLDSTELDVVIVGAGVSGLYALYHLRGLGYRVRVGDYSTAGSHARPSSLAFESSYRHVEQEIARWKCATYRSGVNASGGCFRVGNDLGSPDFRRSGYGGRREGGVHAFEHCRVVEECSVRDAYHLMEGFVSVDMEYPFRFDGARFGCSLSQRTTVSLTNLFDMA